MRDLAEELYDKAGRQGNWMVIRQVTTFLVIVILEIEPVSSLDDRLT